MLEAFEPGPMLQARLMVQIARQMAQLPPAEDWFAEALGPEEITDGLELHFTLVMIREHRSHLSLSPRDREKLSELGRKLGDLRRLVDDVLSP